MTFTSTHQQIFIKFSIFCIFFSNSEVCTDTTICWLVLEPLYPVLESCDMKSGSPPPHRTSLVTNGPKELLELKPILHSGLPVNALCLTLLYFLHRYIHRQGEACKHKFCVGKTL